LPAIVYLGVISLLPVLQAVYFSFTDYDLIGTAQWVGWTNYLALWNDRTFRQVLGNTLIYLVVAVPLLVSLPLGLAILVNQRLRGISFFRMVYYLPVIVSVVVASIAWKWVYAEQGILNGMASLLAGQTVRIPWLTDPRLAIYGVIAVTVWRGLGYYMVVYLAGLQGIPSDLYEAAAMDGVDGWRQHWHITIPLMTPYIVLVSVISGIAAMKIFEEVYIMTKGDPAQSTKTIVYYLYEQGFNSLEMGYASAIGVGLFLVIMGISLAMVRFVNIQDDP
jgi:putative chitobiose transport system permease protein